jgi:glucose-6-phosphate isomerase
MKEIEYRYSNSLIAKNKINESGKKLQNEIKKMNLAAKKEYQNERASINLPNDTENLKKIKNLIKEKQKLNPKYFILIGIGGSNLGTIAIQEAILGKLYNLKNPPLKILYADTVDSDLLYDINSIIEPVLKKGENIIINVISKSGGTTETISNFEIIENILKKYKKNYQKYIVVTSDKNSNLWKISLDKGYETIEIPKKVGGRYSVFSSVGLFPLGMLNIDIDELLKGARVIKEKCLNQKLEKNPAALNASIIYNHRLNRININDLFLFDNDLESTGKWYRQLMAESIGKEYDTNDKQVFEGITPTVSIGSTDLHSMAQLYLGGPYDKFTTFVKINKNREIVNIPNNPEYEELVKSIQSKSIKDIMDAIYNGVKTAFIKGKRPFAEIILPDKSEFSIGQFIQFKQMEIIYLGNLLNVNPFDQPNVELYKIETKKILEKNP